MASNDRILVSTPEMESTITKYENARSTLMDAFGSLESAKNHLDNCYMGPAKVAFSLKWVDIYLNVKSAERAIDESVSGLRKTIAQMEEGEGNVGATFTSLDTGKSAPTYL